MMKRNVLPLLICLSVCCSNYVSLGFIVNISSRSSQLIILLCYLIKQVWRSFQAKCYPPLPPPFFLLLHPTAHPSALERPEILEDEVQHLSRCLQQRAAFGATGPAASADEIQQLLLATRLQVSPLQHPNPRHLLWWEEPETLNPIP